MTCIFLLAAMSCNTKNPTQQSNPIVKDSIQKDTVAALPQADVTDNQKYFTTTDSGMIWNDAGDTLKYAKADFNKIIKEHSEFFSDYPQSPEVENACHCTEPNSEFSSEVGTDVYYMFYTFYVRKLHTEGKFPEVRKKLTSIYSNINKLFQNISRGGSYFGHMESRIPAFVEFSMKNYIDYEEFKNKHYDISKQKSLFIQVLQQELIDETHAYAFLSASRQQAQINDLSKIIVDIEKEITDKYILNQAQRFRYGQY